MEDMCSWWGGPLSSGPRGGKESAPVRAQQLAAAIESSRQALASRKQRRVCSAARDVERRTSP